MNGLFQELSIFLILIVYYLLDSTDSAFICDEAHNLFKCNTTEGCISLTQKCDFRYDCDDKSDEIGCVRPPCNISTHFLCTNGKCIHSNWKCDGRNDCFDGSDETDSLCSGECKEGHFRCRGSQACMPNSYKCDGDIDCEGEEDEENCPPRECRHDEYRCSSKQQCIDISYQCDGETDCNDGSDETGCVNKICQDDQFTCADKSHCIDEEWRCDGISDCKDDSDEQDCEENSNKCPSKYFSCKSGPIPCVPIGWKCDGNGDCSDESDELNCDNIKDRCPFGEVHCANRRQCINKRKLCDGYWDCIDKSDEKSCEDKKPSKPSESCPLDTHYRCPGDEGKCIPSTKLCDVIEDCPGGEDEKQGPHFCNHNECVDTFRYSNCSQICINLRVGFKCDCKPGYQLASDEQTCEDIDECKVTFNPCEQFCLNTEGSYKCTCWEGYTLIPQTGTCKPSDEKHDVALLVSNRNKIKKITLDRLRDTETIIVVDKNVNCLSVDIRNDYVYLVDFRSDTVSRTKISSPGTPEIILRKPATVGLGRSAVDWIHGLLFWVDNFVYTISVSRLDGTDTRTLYTNHNKVIMGFAVHPKYGYIFMNSFPRLKSLEKSEVDIGIQRCDMDGDISSCVSIVTEQFKIIYDIAIDYDQDIVYWTDPSLKLLAACDLNGQNRRNLIYSENHKPYSVAVFSGRVYWTDGESHKLFSGNRTGGDMKVVDNDVSYNMDLEVLNKEAQPEATNYCLDSPCKFLCLPKGLKDGDSPRYTCACPDGYVTKENDKNDCKPTAISSSTPPSTPSSTTPSTSSSMTPSTSSSTTPSTSSSTTPSTSSASSTSKRTPSTSTTSTTTGNTSSDGGVIEEQGGSSMTKPPGMSSGTQTVVIIGVIALLGFTATVTWCIFRLRKKRSARMSMNFNNPIYRKVTGSVASNNSSIIGLTDPSPGTSSGDISSYPEDEEEGTAGLINNEEIPDGSDPSLI